MNIVGIRPGTKFVYRLQSGEDWALHPVVGIVVVHPERPPIWVREEADRIVCTPIEPTVSP